MYKISQQLYGMQFFLIKQYKWGFSLQTLTIQHNPLMAVRLGFPKYHP